MTYVPATTPTASRPTHATNETAQLWALLYGTWSSPRRASRMTSRREHDRKYSDIASYSFNTSHLAAHLAGTATYAATLGAAGTARAGCKDYDSADEAEIVAALDQAQQKGITAAAIVMPGRAGEHTGGHLWVFYDRPYAESDIRAQLRTIRRSGKGEDYPSGNPIRLPFGYHQIKKTRGLLILQDGRRFTLDTQLAAGIDALLSLPRNGKPQPAPISDTRISGAAWGEAYNPAEWENLPDGSPLWHSAYIAAAAQRRPDLAKLLRGERVTLIKKDDTRDDSNSAQVAALAYNLLSADVCKQQARAIADYLYPQLRPDKTREHYRAHFDVELERYTPKHYRSQTIRSIGTANKAAPQPLPPAEYRPEPKSRARKDRPQRVTGAAGYLRWLHTQIDPQSGSVMLSQSQCAERIGCCIRTIKRYEKTLGTQIERRVFAQRQAGCLFILAPDVVTTSAEDVVIANAGIAQQSAENAQPATVQVEHTAAPAHQPTAAPIRLADLRQWVSEAFDAYPGRASFRKVLAHIQMLSDGRTFDADKAKRFYEAERDKRQRDRSWRQFLASLPTMPQKKLTKLAKRIERILLGGADGPEGSFYSWACQAQPHVSAEFENPVRISAIERLKPQKRRRGVSVDQVLLLAEIEPERPKAQPIRPIGRAVHLVEPTAQQGTSARVCSPQPPAPAGADLGIVARLARLRDQRQAAQAVRYE